MFEQSLEHCFNSTMFWVAAIFCINRGNCYWISSYARLSILYIKREDILVFTGIQAPLQLSNTSLWYCPPRLKVNWAGKKATFETVSATFFKVTVSK